MQWVHLAAATPPNSVGAGKLVLARSLRNAGTQLALTKHIQKKIGTADLDIGVESYLCEQRFLVSEDAALQVAQQQLHLSLTQIAHHLYRLQTLLRSRPHPNVIALGLNSFFPGRWESCQMRERCNLKSFACSSSFTECDEPAQRCKVGPYGIPVTRHMRSSVTTSAVLTYSSPRGNNSGSRFGDHSERGGACRRPQSNHITAPTLRKTSPRTGQPLLASMNITSNKLSTAPLAKIDVPRGSQQRPPAPRHAP